MKEGIKMGNKQKTWIIIGIVILVIALIGISNNFAKPDPLNNNSKNSTSDPITSTIGTIMGDNNGGSSNRGSSGSNGNSNNVNNPQQTDSPSNPKKVCTECGGSGTIVTQKIIWGPCSFCGGDGIVSRSGHSDSPCGDCFGTGQVQISTEGEGKICPKCGGSGLTT
jgi:hypothetical protein